jgi:hypothetical protein
MRIAIGLLTLAAVTLASSAQAHERYFTYTYDWFTPSRGEKELETWWTQRSGGEADGQIEFEYGITDRWLAAPYLLLQRRHGGEFRLDGWKLEQRYRFGDLAYHKFLPAAYFEVKKEHGDPYELEAKLITSYLFGHRNSVWSTNLIFERELKGGEKLEVGYATGVSLPVKDRLRAGVELFGNWTKNEHFIGPTVGYKFAPDTKLLVTAGFKYRGDEGGAVRLIFEKEWR